MPGVGGYVVLPRSNGTLITDTIYNQDHSTHWEHAEPQFIDDASADISTSRIQESPATLATSLEGEIRRLRYCIANMGGVTFWDQATAPVSQVQFRQAGNPIKNIVSSSAETSLFSPAPTLLGGRLGTDRMLRVTLVVDYLNNSGSNRSHTIRFKYGAGTPLTLIVSNVTDNAARRWFQYSFTLSACGVTNAQVAMLDKSTGGFSAVEPAISEGTNSSLTIFASAIDSTVDRTVDVTWQHGTNHAQISARPYILIGELL